MSMREDIRRAIALGYEPEKDRAPRVLAKGLGEIAEAIIAIARKHGIQLYEDEALSRSLYALQIGQEIPEQFYVAVAEVLAYVYRLDAELRKRKGIR